MKRWSFLAALMWVSATINTTVAEEATGLPNIPSIIKEVAK
jgi:hypothetical protein